MMRPSDQPPPPPPPNPPLTPPPKKTPPLAHFGAVALLVVVVLPQLFLSGEDRGIYTFSYRLGRMIGAAIFGLLVAALIWWIVRRTRPKDARPSWSPWIFFIAAGVAFVGGLANVAQRAADVASEPKSAQETEAPYDGPASSYFLEPEGYEYRELPAKVKEQVEAQFAADTEAAEEISDFDARQVLKAGRPVGATIVVLGNAPPEAWDESHEGFIKGFEEAGDVTLEPTTVAGTEALVAEIPQGVAIALLDRNLVIQVIGFNEASARDIAEAQVAALED